MESGHWHAFTHVRRAHQRDPLTVIEFGSEGRKVDLGYQEVEVGEDDLRGLELGRLGGLRRFEILVKGYEDLTLEEFSTRGRWSVRGYNNLTFYK